MKRRTLLAVLTAAMTCLMVTATLGCTSTSIRRTTQDGEKSTSNSYVHTAISAKEAADAGEFAGNAMGTIGNLVGGPWGLALTGAGGLIAGLFHGNRVKANADKAYDEGAARA